MSPTPSDTPKPDRISWWFQEALRHDGSAPSPALEGVQRTDVTIVGGGFTGLWTALLLKERKPDLDIVLVEAGLCGSGASGMNGGKVHGYWGSLGTLAANFGADAALEAAKLGTLAQDAIRVYATAHGRDIWWREAGNIRVSTSDAQDIKLQGVVAAARRLGVPETAVALDKKMLDERIRSRVFRQGIYLPEGANLQPARLARALRQSCIEAGVRIFENTTMTGMEDGGPCIVRTARGEIHCDQVVLATNTGLAGHALASGHIAVFSSYAVMSEEIPDLHDKIGWDGDEGLADLRMFVHYFRKAEGNRILMGSGSGPIAYGARYLDPVLSEDMASAGRAAAALSRLMPGLGRPRIEKSWGGGIDISADRLPFFKSSANRRVHVGCGYSGHGVNATRIGGECLSSLVLGESNRWTNSLFCRRDVPRFPPEPFRTVGGRMVRAAILSCEEAEDLGQEPGLAARFGAWLPKALNIKVGMR
ncbi:FAD dependent oxidoreductase [Nitratireductor indicus C115]|uniref:FAD dependent oxidoreductase n=1 Tax=Nitratireductor indicus C115 TaxID=1231190 RepID=K2NXM8_9HYPH|nr:FAD-binding oxidoreductase [Nitratireductor indicus]EKF42644.1 FAD dependent oxidoreductase [Nitratireductor indicus C115]SFQ38161.1 Glycine/D-amino acid oxidase [Nitratireductor indicus]